jgi:hypothetical protein
MPRKLLQTVLFVISVLNFALAQDPWKSEPDHYRLAFQNESVEVVNIHYGPHERSGMFSHPAGVIVALSSGHIRFVDEQGNVKVSSYSPGDTRWVPSIKHRGENLEDTTYSAIFIGLKSGKVSGNGSVSAKDAVLALNEQTRELIRSLSSTK